MEAFTCSDSVSFSAQLDSKCRITIPARIRKKLGVEAGDSLLISVESAEIRKKKTSSLEEAKDFIQGFTEVQSFSFDGETVEVVLRD